MFAGAVVGAAWGYSIQYGTRRSDYPINVGGRPYNSWPAFIVGAFEFMLLVAVAAGLVRAAWRRRLPKLYHPIFAAKAFERASRDRFCPVRRGDAIRASIRPRLRESFDRLGAEQIEEVPRDEVVPVAALALAVGVCAFGGLRQHGQPAERLTLRSALRRSRIDWPVCRRRTPSRATTARSAGAAAAHHGAARTRAASASTSIARLATAGQATGRDDRAARLSASAVLLQRRLRDAPNQHFYDVITHGYGVMYPYADRVGARRPLGDRRLHPCIAGERDARARRCAARQAAARCNDGARLGGSTRRRRRCVFGVVGCIVGAIIDPAGVLPRLAVRLSVLARLAARRRDAGAGA